jgi:hypothetical protein
MFAVLFVSSGCARKPSTDPSQEMRPEEPLEPLTVTRAHLETPQPQSVVHKVFSVSKYAQFSFVVPPHHENARLRGNFRSFTKRSDPDSTSNNTADVDVMLLNEQELDEFLHGPPHSVPYEVDSAHDQKVDWRVPTTYDEPITYHLVFANSEGGTKIKFIEANFTVSFE